MPNPKIKIHYKTSDYVIEGACVLLLLTSVITLIVSYSALPDTIPTRYSSSGDVVRSGSPAMLFLLLFISLITYLKLTLLSFFPHIHNYPIKITEENAEDIYRMSFQMLHFLKLAIVLLFAYLIWQTTQIGLERADTIDHRILILLIGSTIGIPVYAVYRMFKYRRSMSD